MLPKAVQNPDHETTMSSALVFEKHKPLTTVDYEQQLDYLSEWINEWGSTERFVFIDKLLSKCEKQEIQLLWTVLQPTLHRDFAFSSLTPETNCGFSPISIPVTREIHRNARFSKSKGQKVPFLKSAVLRNEDDVRTWTSCSVMPIMKSPMPPSITRLSYTGSPETVSGLWKSHQSYFGVRFPGITKPLHARSVLSIKSAPPRLACSQAKHQMLRRHMQKREKEQNYSNTVKPADYLKEKDRDFAVFNCFTQTKLQDQVKSSKMVDEEIQTVLAWFGNQWGDWKRNEFLQVFLKILDPSELFYISGLITVRQYRDFVTLLPRQLSRNILSFLQVEELAVISLASRAWNNVANDEQLWQYKCKGIYVGVPLNKNKHWKTIYKESLELKKKWVRGHCSILELCSHTKRVLVVSAFENFIASGSFDKTIKIWDSKSGRLVQTLEGHSKGVWSLCFVSNTILVSGSHDATIKVWNLQTGSCVKILMSHRGPVWAMERKGDILLTGSGDKTAKVWNIRGCQLMHTLIGHTASVFCVDIDLLNRRAFTGSADHSVRIWNLDNGECIKYFYIAVSGVTCAVTSLSYDQGYLVTAAGTSVLLWDTGSKMCIREFTGHEDRVESVKLKLKTVRGKIDHGIIYSAGKDEVVKYWDFHDGTCLRTLRHNMGSVNTLFVDDSRIIAGSEDNKIRIWSFLPRTSRQKRNEKTEIKTNQ